MQAAPEAAAPGGTGTRVFQPVKFGRYYLIDKIAVGGMAEVYKAKSYSEAGFEKLLVIKRILPHLSDNEEFVDMFIDEAKITVALQQANIVETYDFGKQDDCYFIAMECVEGKDVKGVLRKLAGRRQYLPPVYAAYISHEVCRGLDFAHRHTDRQGEHLGIVHRDVSPSNVLLSYRGEVKIADFGIAKAQISLYNTKDGVLKGKFEYMSPEQATGEPITHQSDIFSAGIVLHEMLTGRRLFKTDSELATLEKIKAVDISSPREVNPGVPPELDAIVMQALSRDPADRFADARQMQNALQDYLSPLTSDVIEERFSLFMGELFAAEIADEERRFQEGSRIAEELRQTRPDDLLLAPEWEPGGATGTRTLQTAGSKLPFAAAGLAILLALGVGGVAAAALVLLLRDDPPVAPATAVVQIRAVQEVPLTVSLDGVPVGPPAAQVTADDLTPGQSYALRVEAEGFVPHEETITLSPGERLRTVVDLEAIAAPEPEPPEVPVATTDPKPAAVASPIVKFTSKPSGATVLVGGRPIGRTPLTWKGGTPGKVEAEYQLDGYVSARVTVTVPEKGETAHQRKSLRPIKVAPGRVRVTFSPGWANVYIDGKRVDETPMAPREISAGRHTIRVVNPETGFEDSRTVVIASGKLESVVFKAR